MHINEDLVNRSISSSWSTCARALFPAAAAIVDRASLSLALSVVVPFFLLSLLLSLTLALVGGGVGVRRAVDWFSRWKASLLSLLIESINYRLLLVFALTPPFVLGNFRLAQYWRLILSFKFLERHKSFPLMSPGLHFQFIRCSYVSWNETGRSHA